uniref:Uncharacterized protein n=1 Tax=Arundo donax TaxID=35708 RepID=A0A0A9A8W3_ARUDO
MTAATACLRTATCGALNDGRGRARWIHARVRRWRRGTHATGCSRAHSGGEELALANAGTHE